MILKRVLLCLFLLSICFHPAFGQYRSKSVVKKVYKSIERGDITSAAAYTAEHLKKKPTSALYALSGALLHIQGRDIPASEQFSNVNPARLDKKELMIVLPLSITMEDYKKTSESLAALFPNDSQNLWYKILFILPVCMSKTSFLILLCFFFAILSVFIKLTSIRHSWLSLIIAYAAVAAILVYLQFMARDFLLYSSLGWNNPSQCLSRAIVVAAVMTFFVFYLIFSPIKWYFALKRRSIGITEITLEMLIGALLILSVGNLQTGTRISEAYGVCTLLFTFGLAIFHYHTYKRSFSFMEIPAVAKAASEAVSEPVPPVKRVSDNEVAASLNNRLKQENFTEVTKLGKNYLNTNQRKFDARILFTTLNTCLSIERVSAAADFLKKIIKKPELRSSPEILYIARARLKVLTGDLSGYLKIMDILKKKDTFKAFPKLVLYKNELEGFFNYQKKAYSEAAISFVSAYEDQIATFNRCRNAVWAMECSRLSSDENMQTIFEHIRRLRGLEWSQSFLFLAEAFMVEKRDKDKAINFCKKCLALNNHNQLGILTCCRLLVNQKRFSEAEAAARKIDRKHFLKNQLIELEDKSGVYCFGAGLLAGSSSIV